LHARRARAEAGAADPVPEHGLHLLRARAGARADRRGRAPPRLHALRAARLPYGDPCGRRLLEAARGRAHLRLRSADLHHRRWNPPHHPADGNHAAARLVRRLEHRRELPRARRADARLEPREPGARHVNRQLNRLAIVAIVLLAALVVATTYWQTWAVAGLADRQDNAIHVVAQFEIKRGTITAPGGKPRYATNKVRHERGQTLYFRRYPTEGLLAQTVGYSTPGHAQAGLERSMNAELSGATESLSTVVSKAIDSLRGTTLTGDNLLLTVDAHAQQIALQGLAGR